MNFGKHYWSTVDTAINLVNMFEYFRFTLELRTDTYMIYSKSDKYYVVIRTEKGYRYYQSEKPEVKLYGSDLISFHCAMMTSSNTASIWERITAQYEAFLAEGIDTASTPLLAIVSTDFNHFETLKRELNVTNLSSLYQEALQFPVLKSSVAMDEEGELLFPLYNTSNIVCGYLKDTASGIVPYEYTDTNTGIWYSGLPKKIDQLILFNSPKEAFSFYTQYQPEHTVCIACTTINTTTVTTIMQLKKASKAKKLLVSFTGNTLMKGYLKDLYFIAQTQHPSVILTNTGEYLNLTFQSLDELSFAKFYKKLQEFNRNIGVSYKKINKTKVLNQSLVMRYSIIPKRLDSGYVSCRIPLEAAAIKFMIWAYYKYFLPNDMSVLKPTMVNWHSQYVKGEKVLNYAEFKLVI